MRVEVVIAHGRYSVGAIIPQMPANQARDLIGRGLVKAAEGENETAAFASPQDRMLRPQAMQRKKGR